MATFIFALVILAIAVGWWIYNPTMTRIVQVPNDNTYGGTERRKVEYSLRRFGYIPLGIGLLLLILSFWTVVGTRSVGIPTVFNRPTGETYGNGIHFKAPWINVGEVDARVQPESFKKDHCIDVKIADGGVGCLAIAYRWRINAEQADKAYVDYNKSEDGVLAGIRKALVTTNMDASANEVLGTFDPLEGAEIQPGMTPEQLANIKLNVVPDYKDLSSKIAANFEAKIKDLGGLIDLESVTVSGLRMPKSTQDRINKVNATVANTKVALQEIAVKNAIAQGNRALAESLKDPNVLVAQCFSDLADGKYQPAPGFNCWPGGSGVVIPGVK